MTDLIDAFAPSTWYLIPVVFTTAVTFVTILSVAWVTRKARRRPIPPGAYAPISVLKPLCGVDDGLESNLETFFQLTYPHYEIIFGVAGDSDPAIEVVRRLRKRYPDVRARLIVHDGQRGLNPKVANLRAMLEKGAHDVVVISDSNIAVQPDYLEEMYGHLLDDGVEMVTSLIAGVGEESIGATLENLHLNGYISGYKAGAEVAGIPFVIGKSVMYRRSILDPLGGLESLASVLGEDHVMGRMIQLAGYEIRVCTQPVKNVCVNTSVGRFVLRHLRWGLIRTKLKPIVYLSEPLSSPVAVALMAPLFDVPMVWPVLWAAALVMLRDGVQWYMLRGSDGLLQALPLGPFKELLVLLVWALGPLNDHVSWRGKSYVVGMGTHLYSETPLMAPGEVKEMV